LNLRPLGHEFREYLGFDYAAWSVRDVLPNQLKCPLGDPSFDLGVLDDLPEGILGHQGDRMRVKVMPELALGQQDRVHKLLHLWVARLGVGEYLADEVHWSLHLLRPPGLFSLDHQRRADQLGCR
jgi:hypothetical protein